MDDSSASRPRFKVGDRITLVSPGFHNGQQGNVVAVIEGSFDNVHRYHVGFSDGRSATFFGFELQLLRTESIAAEAEAVDSKRVART
jgi:hypothetical protein